MKRNLLFVLVFMLGNLGLVAQSITITRTIQRTETITDEGVTFEASSDDAEQENDEIDSLFDDDLDAGWEGEPDDQNILSVGLRFRDLMIPRGAVIESAFLRLFSHEGKSTEDVARITIVGEATDNAQTYTEDALITDRPQTSASVLWEVAEEWTIYQPYETVDLSAIIQEIVGREGWEAGNALALMLLGENQGPSEVENAREFESFENIADPEDGGDGQHHPERVPQLHITYRVDSWTPIKMTETITDEGVTFEASSDDAEQENDEIDSLFDDDLDAGWEGEPDDQNILTVGLRFRDIMIPDGAQITSAHLLLFSHEGKTTEDVAKITIVGEAADNAETYTEDALITDRPQTDASVLWEVAEDWEIYLPYMTPDIGPIVQEIVDRDGWTAGNALAFVLLGENQGPSEVENAREFESFENIADPEDGGDGQHHPERVPQLLITYQVASGTTTFASNVRELKVFPNPATQDEVRIELDSDKAAVIRIYNTQSQVLKTVRHQAGKQLMLNIGDLPSGTYYIQAKQENEWYVQKLVVQP